ncbi:glycosyltransferase family 2 protein [Alteriqipengyuania lutimaris]|uniref:glycosyltransferase family 2 protein n=1 Tax=Alteriqipengyuania lutimaris TaxID=1538146 RepID=UPI00178FCB71|nr:glycosyltransferase family 2 protein [Alteriqipengyuania lutimaris]MBB3033602.1 cellulose synthase/poly-beta-1,6-N-acetylglucosamine synthase-like glycosyltransferase [Alteriqipengyuania lutimaris]
MALRNIVALVQLLIAAWVFMTRVKPGEGARDLWHRYADLSLPISVIAPAFNEELSIVQSVKALLALEYPEHEVIVVNDGSKDDTLGQLIRSFDMYEAQSTQIAQLQQTRIRGTYRSPRYPNLLVVDKENGRKADAANAGIGFARTPLVCVIDADSIIEPDGLLRAAEPFIYDGEGLIAVGGAIRIANGCTIKDGSLQKIGIAKEMVPRFQIVEYLRAFLMNRVANAHTNTLTLISGAFGLFRRSTLVEMGGYRHDTVGEDLELVVRMHRFMRDKGRKYRIAFVPDIVCWTEAPAALRGLDNQRARWQQGALETLTRHRGMIGNPRYGRIGLLAMPQIVLEDILGPPAELLGYLVLPAAALLGLLDPMMAIAFFFVSVVFGCALSLGTLVLEEQQLRRTPSARDLLRIGVAAVLENFGYRQINLWYRLNGILRFFRKDSTWAAVPRVGFTSS